MKQPGIPFRRLLIALLALTAGSAPGIARSGYAVEVVIFRHWEAGGGDAEFWSHRPQPIARSATQHLVALGPVASGADAPAFTRLPDAQLQLSGIRQRLEHSKDYEVLLHVGWRQPSLGSASVPVIVLPLNWSPPALPIVPATPMGAARSQNPFDYLPADTRLWGTLRLLRRRYLHFQVDLRFRRSGIGGAPGGDTVTVYPMTQSRRMRASEIHYLDHPVLGIVVQARPLSHGHEGSR